MEEINEIEIDEEKDVVYEQGGTPAMHVGTRTFRHGVGALRSLYYHRPKDMDRNRAIIDFNISRVRARGGRFLSRLTRMHPWTVLDYERDYVAIRTKVMRTMNNTESVEDGDITHEFINFYLGVADQDGAGPNGGGAGVLPQEVVQVQPMHAENNRPRNDAGEAEIFPGRGPPEGALLLGGEGHNVEVPDGGGGGPPGEVIEGQPMHEENNRREAGRFPERGHPEEPILMDVDSLDYDSMDSINDEEILRLANDGSGDVSFFDILDASDHGLGGGGEFPEDLVQDRPIHEENNRPHADARDADIRGPAEVTLMEEDARDDQTIEFGEDEIEISLFPNVVGLEFPPFIHVGDAGDDVAGIHGGGDEHDVNNRPRADTSETDMLPDGVAEEVLPVCDEEKSTQEEDGLSEAEASEKGPNDQEQQSDDVVAENVRVNE